MKEGKLGITGAVASAMIASSLTAMTPASADVSLSELKIQYGPDLEALGEVQSIDTAKGFVVVAGQRIAISRQTIFLIDQKPADLAKGFSAVRVGDELAVSGELDAPATTIDRLSDSYVPGSTPVYVKGKLSAIDSLVGTAKLDALTIDFTPAMSSPSFQKLDLGEIVEAAGVRPTSNGKLLVSDLARVTSIAGTSIVSPGSIAGTSTVAPSSIAGTSVAKPSSIAGTSKVAPDSIAGTSITKPSSIAGTSKVTPDSIAGTSLVKPSSIAGTSVVKASSIAGTSKVAPDSIAGTSVVKPSSIAGTSKVAPDSIAGTSIAKPSSIAGTSVVKPRSIAGTSGAQPGSIAGTSF
jgi:hypothetical protein